MKLAKLRQNIFMPFLVSRRCNVQVLSGLVDLSKDKKIEVSGKIFMESGVGVTACNMIIIIVN